MEGFVKVRLTALDLEHLKDYRRQHHLTVDQYIKELTNYLENSHDSNALTFKHSIMINAISQAGPMTSEIITHPRGSIYGTLEFLAKECGLSLSTFIRSAIRVHLKEAPEQLRLGIDQFRLSSEEQHALAKPAPAYIGIDNNLISLVERDFDDEDRSGLRSKLVVEQKRIADWFTNNWHRLQVDQRIIEHVQAYSMECSNDHNQLNVFTIDDEIRIVKYGIGEDIDALGGAGTEQWKNFERNHAVLTSLYPEMNDYRKALANFSSNIDLPENTARQLINILEQSSSQDIVSPEVPSRIRKSFEAVPDQEADAKRKRTYDVSALAARTGSVICQMIEYLPKIEKASSSASALWIQYWPLLKELMKKINWL